MEKCIHRAYVSFSTNYDNFVHAIKTVFKLFHSTPLQVLPVYLELDNLYGGVVSEAVDPHLSRQSKVSSGGMQELL